MLSGCTQGTPGTEYEPNDTEAGDTAAPPKINIVCTIFPQYDWVREILRDYHERFELTLLIDNTIDLHSFQPSIRDIAIVSTADLFIYVGGHSDGWVENALAQAINPDLTAISLVESLGDAIKMGRLTEGMEHVCDDECDEDHGDDETGELHEEEHVWTSLRNTMVLCEIIKEAIIALDPDNADVYRENYEAYALKLAALDAEYQNMVNAAQKNTLVFGDRFPFLYLIDDYGLNHYAAFSGCFAASEISMSTIVTLSRKLDDYDLNYIMVTETGNHEIAQTIINATKDKDHGILVLNGMKGVTSGDIQSGVTYLSIMKANLEVLREALN
jgi:zinc transport system substrate-binding protein